MKIITGIFLLFISQQIVAQDIKLAGVQYLNYASAPVKDGGGNYHTSFHEVGAFAAYPVQSKNKKTIVVNSVEYALITASVFNNATGVTSNHNFQSIAYNLSFIHYLNEKWKIAGELTPSLASDFKNKLSNEDFFIQGSLLAIKKINTYTSIGAGVTYTTKLGAPLWLPALQLRYYKNRQKLNILLPSFADYAYQIDQRDKLNAGLRVGLNGANFHVSANDINSSVDVDKLRYSRINLGPAVSYKIGKMIKLEATGGISVARKYEFLDKQGTKYNASSNNTGFFNVGMALVRPAYKEH